MLTERSYSTPDDNKSSTGLQCFPADPHMPGR